MKTCIHQYVNFVENVRYHQTSLVVELRGTVFHFHLTITEDSSVRLVPRLAFLYYLSLF